MEKEVIFTFSGDSSVPFVYHERKTIVNLSELRELYAGCKVSSNIRGFEIVLPDGRTRFEMPFYAIESEDGRHYLPLEEILREEPPMLHQFGFVVPLLLTRHYFGSKVRHGVYPCNLEVNDIGAATFEIIDLEEGTPDHILLYSDGHPVIPDRTATYLKVRIRNKNITLIAIPIKKAAAICCASEEEMLDMMHAAYCNVQETEWQISQSGEQDTEV